MQATVCDSAGAGAVRGAAGTAALQRRGETVRTVWGVVFAAVLVAGCGGDEAQSAPRGGATETAAGETATGDSAATRALKALKALGALRAVRRRVAGCPPCRSKWRPRRSRPSRTPLKRRGRSSRCRASSCGPTVEGRLVQIYVREGGVVGAGAPLFKVDDAELRAQVARAEAERDLAQQALTRTRQLLAAERDQRQRAGARRSDGARHAGVARPAPAAAPADDGARTVLGRRGAAARVVR